MGKSGSRRKKGGNPATAVVNNGHQPATASTAAALGVLTSKDIGSGNNGVMAVDSSMLLRRAQDMKEEGNHLFECRDYEGALNKYEDALKLTPKTHPDRAVFHSNRAACLMQMKPVDFNAVITECSLALLVQPRFGRALLRRARALEALSKFDLAFQDVQTVLASDPDNRDALEIARRLRAALAPRHEAQQDLQSRPSPAALGASAVRGAPIAGFGPCLPSRPVPKRPPPPSSKPVPSHCPPSPPTKPATPFQSAEFPKGSHKDCSSNKIAPPNGDASRNNNHLSSNEPHLIGVGASPVPSTNTPYRPLKLVYGHDIRLARMPVNCSFRHLREIVAKRFPSSKSVLIKYRDADDDLVTITGTDELRLAELCIDAPSLEDRFMDSKLAAKDYLRLLRLHIVEVEPDQEPELVEEEEKVFAVENADIKSDDDGSGTRSDAEVSSSKVVDKDNANGSSGPKTEDGKDRSNVGVDCKEVEIDDWLFEFAQLFRTHVGIDPDAHVDIHDLGMELCSEALEETVTSEEAQGLFEMAASKFQEVAALAFFNWGNVHMCAARKRMSLDDSSSKEEIAKQLQVAYDWVRERYALAGQKYDEALLIKPDFYEGLLALGQQHFEMAKLQWSYALASKIDLSCWDYLETINLFDSAEAKMKTATEMWEKLEEQRLKDLKDPVASNKDDLLKRKKRQMVSADVQRLGDGQEMSLEESTEQAAAMKSQIHLFWGNMLFERSQVEFKLGLRGWKTNLDGAIERFRLAGASEADMSVVLKNHASTVLNDNSPSTSSIAAVAAEVNADSSGVASNEYVHMRIQ